jgi:IS5 family transposase
VVLGPGLIRKALMTPGATHDSQPADQFITGDEKAVYADKAYQKKERRAALRGSGIKDRIMNKSHRGHLLTFWRTLHNKLIAGPRRTIECIFESGSEATATPGSDIAACSGTAATCSSCA